MDNLVSSVASPAVNIELHFVDVPTSDHSSNVSTVHQNVIDYNPSVTSSETQISMEQLFSVIGQEQQQTEDEGNQQVEVPQPDPQATDLVLEEEDLPERLKKQWVCDQCGKFFRSRSGFHEHIDALHKGSRHVCHICGQSMKYATNLAPHMRTVHNIGGPKRKMTFNRKCQQCGKTFRSNGLLYYHLKKVHKISKPMKCKVCGGSFSIGAEWYEHKKLHPKHYSCHTCNVCKSRFISLTGYRKHLLRSGHGNNVERDNKGDKTTSENVETRAKDCSTDVIYDNEKTSLENSINNETASRDAEQTGLIACPKCGRNYKTYTSYQRHINQKCCQNGHTGRLNPNRKKRVRNEVLLCCGKIYAIHQEYLNHVQLHYIKSDGIKGGKRRFKCPVCKKIVALSSLLYHQKMHSGLKMHACDKCDYKCIIASDLDKHVLKHTDTKPYRCKFCGRDFRNLGQRKVHEDTHLGIQHECGKCLGKFNDPQRRNKHQRRCPGNMTHWIKPTRARGSLGYICNVCFGFFFLSHHLRAHQRECQKEGTSAGESELNTQATMIKIPGESGEVKEVPLSSLYICQSCSQVFKNESDHGSHEVPCIILRNRMRRKKENKSKNKFDGNGAMVDVGFDEDTSDDSDDVDEQLIGDDSVGVPQISNQSSKTDAIQAKQTDGEPWKRNDKCTFLSSAIACCTCNKRTDEIIKEQCTQHHNGTSELGCNTCGKTTKKILEDHKCTPHFFCGDCKEVFSCKEVLEQHSIAHWKKKNKCDFLCSYCYNEYHSLAGLQFHNHHVHHAVVNAMQGTGSVDQAHRMSNQHNLREEVVVQEQRVGVTRNRLPSGKPKQQVVILLSSPKKTISPMATAGGSSHEQGNAPHIITLKRLRVDLQGTGRHNGSTFQSVPSTGHHSGSTFLADGKQMKFHKMPEVLKENVSKTVRCGKQPASRMKMNQGIESSVAHAGSSKSVHTMEKVKKRAPLIVYQCPVCKKNFTVQSSLVVHLSTHGINTQKETPQRAPTVAHQCFVCKKNFSIRSNLLVHLRLHDTKMPYQCNYCYMCYAKQSELKTHMTEKHKEVSDVLQAAKSGLSPGKL